MADTTITARENGPYIVQGTIKMVNSDGKEVNLDSDIVVLCRCGQSANKPFCDGTHRTCGFQG